MTETTDSSLPVPDLGLLRPVLREDVKDPSVHLERFEKGAKRLSYVGTRHGTDIDNKTHYVIAQTLRKYPPQLIIIEGVETDLGLSPDLGFKKDDLNSNKRWYQSEESIHTAEAARHLKIPFLGGEVSGDKIEQALKEQGYSRKDFMAAIAIRTIPIAKRTGSLKDESQLKAVVESALTKHYRLKHIPTAERLSFEEFTAIYEAHKAELGNKPLMALTAPDSNPNHVTAPNHFQKICAIMDRVRDEHLVKVISEALGKQDKVMVVYGNAHLHAAGPVFENMFGQKPAIEKLILDEVPVAKTALPIEASAPAVKPSPNSRVPALLRYSAGVLTASAAIVALVGALPLAVGLLAFGFISYQASGSLERNQQNPAPAVAPPAMQTKKLETAVPLNLPAHTSGWVARTQSTHEQASRGLA